MKIMESKTLIFHTKAQEVKTGKNNGQKKEVSTVIAVLFLWVFFAADSFQFAIL